MSIADQKNTWREIQTVHEFERPSPRTPEVVRVRIIEVNDKQFVDIRIYRLNVKAGEFRPTRRGIALPVECCGDLHTGTSAVLDELEYLQ